MAYEGPWPERVFVGMGSEEYGAKGLAGRGPELDRHLLKTVRRSDGESACSGTVLGHGLLYDAAAMHKSVGVFRAPLAP